MIKSFYFVGILFWGLIFTFGCHNKPAASIDDAPLVSANHSDATGKSLRFGQPPKKIISLSQPLTEMFFDLGGGNRVIGVSEDTEIQWDDKRVPTLPFPSNIDMTIDTLKIIKPEVVFALKEQFETPEKFREAIKPTPVFFCDLTRMDDVYKTAEILGDYLNNSSEAKLWVKQMKKYVSKIESDKQAKNVSCAIMVSYDPIEVIGGDNYLNDIITSCGGKNVFASKKGKLNAITIDELLKIQPEYVFIVTENEAIGKELLKTHPQIKNLKALQNEKMLTLDPAVFLRPGMRLYQAYALLGAFMNPKLDVKKIYEEAFPQHEVEN